MNLAEAENLRSSPPSTARSDGIARIGDNNPPSLPVILAENHAGLLAEVEVLAKRADATPKEVAADSLDLVGNIVIDAKALWQRADLARKIEKDPHLKAGQDVDDFFRTPLDRIRRIADALTGRATIYRRAVDAAERQRQLQAAEAARAEEARRQELADKAAEAGRKAHAEQHVAKAEEAAAKAANAEAAAAAKPETFVTASGVRAGGKKEWTFEITDFAAIPLAELRPYFKRDAIEAAIKLAVRQGVRDLAGVRIFEDVRATFR